MASQAVGGLRRPAQLRNRTRCNDAAGLHGRLRGGEKASPGAPCAVCRIVRAGAEIPLRDSQCNEIGDLAIVPNSALSCLTRQTTANGNQALFTIGASPGDHVRRRRRTSAGAKLIVTSTTPAPSDQSSASCAAPVVSPVATWDARKTKITVLVNDPSIVAPTYAT